MDETLLLLKSKKTLTKVRQTYFTFMKQKIYQKELDEIMKKDVCLPPFVGKEVGNVVGRFDVVTMS